MKKRIAVGLTLLALSSPSMAQQCVASKPIQPTIAPGKCKPGYVLQYGVFGEECLDIFVHEQQKVLNGMTYSLNGDGNVQSVYKYDLTTGQVTQHVAEFGGWDELGRPSWFYDATSSVSESEVQLEWPGDGGCLPSAIIHKGWRSALTWADSEHVATIDVPYNTRPLHYGFNFYPDGAVHMETTDLPLYAYHWETTRAYSEAGDQIGYNSSFVPVAPSTSAALAPNRSAAATPAPDPFFRPKVQLARPVPGGQLGPQLLGVQTLLLPVYDLLAQQIGRFFASTIPTQQELMAACAQRLHGEYGRCEAAVSDQFGARPWPPEVEAEKQDCDKSARERHRFCLAGQIAIAPPLRLPTLTGSEAQHKCESAAWQQYRNDIATCEGQYPQGGAQLVDCYQRALTKYNGTKAACKGK